jgi:hypothetical protein
MAVSAAACAVRSIGYLLKRKRGFDARDLPATCWRAAYFDRHCDYLFG